MTTQTLALDVLDVSKSYGSVQANVDVNLRVRRQTVHAVLGENGAGKSTLMKILFGVESPDSGAIRVDGEAVSFSSPREAIRAGVGMVFQHFGLVPELSALDNIALGAERGPAYRIDRRAEHDRVQGMMEGLTGAVALTMPVSRMSAAQQQRVEILKALYRGARLLILDEPTALLAPQERQGLFDAVDQLVKQGTTVIFITHKLEEALSVADDVTVMRHGRVVASYPVAAASRDRLVQDMVGGQPRDVVPPLDRPAGPEVMRLDEITAARAGDGFGLAPTSMVFRGGEITGVVGIDGHGQQQLCQIAAGVRPPSEGRVTVAGRSFSRWSRRHAMAAGVSYVPEDRLAEGVANDEPIVTNIMANRITSGGLVRRGLIRHRRLAALADELIEGFDVRCRDRNQRTGDLSGGNIQKVVLAREISVRPRMLVVCEPTRGLDIGAISAIHGRIVEAADDGVAVLVQSSDLDEVLALATRIAVFREGSLSALIDNRPDLTARAVGELMLGVSPAEPVSTRQEG